MKSTKLFNLMATLFCMVMLVFTVACDNGNGGNGGASFDDCDKIAEEIVLSDGEWTLKAVMVSEEEGTAEITLQATVENNEYTFTSGTLTATMDFAVMFEDSPEALEMFNSLSDAEKNEMFLEDADLQEGTSVTWNGTKATMSASIPEEELAGYKEDLDFDSLPEEFIVKTNADNTKYVISYEEEGYKEEYFISKN